MLRAIEAHLGSRQVSNVIYGAIIGLALIVALEEHPPSARVVVGTLLATAVAIGLAGLYSELLATGSPMRRNFRGPELSDMLSHAAFVAFGIAFPVVFFVLAAIGVLEEASAFTVAKWSGVGLLGFYGFYGARLAGGSVPASALRALAAALIGAFLIGLKALTH